jgi:transposase/signal recognition particle subunit SEC65
MSKRFKDYNQNQIFLFPPSVQDWLPKDHLAYYLSDIVDNLEMKEIFDNYSKDGRGQPPYHPQMMLKVLIYGYSMGVYSSRTIAKKIEEDIAFRYLAAGNFPDFRSISDFRKNNLNAVKGLFLQVLQICQKSGMLKLGHVALDGTKIKANASKHKAMSYGRMKQKEEELKRQINELLKNAYKTDKAEDSAYGSSKRGDELPQELAIKESRLAKIQEAIKTLEEEAKVLYKMEQEQKQKEKQEQEQRTKQKQNETEDNDKDDKHNTPPGTTGGDVKPSAKVKHKQGIPKDKAQKNFTDPDSRIMKNSDKAFIQGYNAQAMVDADSQIIVASSVTNQASDAAHIEYMVETLKANAGRVPKELSADAGYFSEDNLDFLEEEKIDTYIPPDKQPHSRFNEPAPRGRMPANMTKADKMKRKIKTKKGRKKYQLRQTTVEPAFGQIKGVRNFRQFLLRGLEKVEAEWGLVCLTHNLLKLFRASRNNKIVFSH